MRRASILLGLALVLLPPQPATAEGPGTVTHIVLMEAMTVTLTLDRDTVEAGRKAGATAVVHNLGGLNATSVTATLQGASALRMYPGPTRSPPSITPNASWTARWAALRMYPGPTRSPPSITPNASWTARWDVCSTEPGNYLLLVSASGSYPQATFTTESTTVLLTITPGKARGCP